ncbi:hypothetical protein P5673_024978 [Acropora cervicornis]|uniref:Uncharacterized protein n=1 Tax=Acropora cervicornis TaxID=6130 RepID=A0AAD9Q2W9_ACRCE|nr:hypothetical protein P5673_024978 [Acropora cervicornis]
MKFVAVIDVLVVFCLLPIVDATSVSLSSSHLSLNGNAQIYFYGSREAIWNGLSNGNRYPIINSGDTIALRSAYPSGSYSKYWLYCITSYCTYTTCPGTIMTSSKWSSCTSHMKFVIRAKNKMDGQPINSGDTVSIISTAYGSSYRLRCDTSSSWKCRFVSNAVDGTPVQFGDIVAFKYPFGHRYPMINSGDTIALRSAYTYGSLKSHWLSCTSTSCGYNICPGTLITSSGWTSCSGNMKFFIRAMNKMDGQPINSGDTVSIIPTSYGSQYRLRCDTSTTYKCRVTSTTSSFKGNAWLTYSYATFQIFARNAVDGTPLQYGDLVAFKYPYGGRSRWLSYYSYYYYARDCSANSKSSCARQNTYTGFKIFKKL